MKARTGLWACLLSILILLPACMGMRSAGLLSEKGLELPPSAGPNLGSQAKRLTLPDPISKGKESATPRQLQATFAQLPLSFVPNWGQMDRRVKFYGRSGSASFFFARDEVVYSFVRQEGEASPRKVGRSVPDGDSDRQEEGKGRGHVVRLQFVGTNSDPVIEGGEELPGKVSYFIGRDPARWKTGLPTYGQVRYRELWPGIDLIYWREGGRLKYEFIVKSGADLGRIQLVYQGIDRLEVSDTGNLILKTAFGELRDSRPVAYQEVGEGRVEAGFRVGTAPSGFAQGFELKGYNPIYPLILDPGLEYSTFLGGSSWDWGEGIALDAAGNAFVTGQTDSPDFPTQTPLQGSLRGPYDAFVTKLNSAGSDLVSNAGS